MQGSLYVKGNIVLIYYKILACLVPSPHLFPWIMLLGCIKILALSLMMFSLTDVWLGIYYILQPLILTSLLLPNSLASSWPSLLKLIIRQKWRFSVISRVVLIVACSSHALLPFSFLDLVMLIGEHVLFQEINHWLLLLSWWFPNFLEVQEAEYRVSFFFRSRV